MGDPTGAEVRVVDLDARSVLVLVVAVAGVLALAGIASSIPRAITWIVVGGVLALALNPLVTALRARLHCSRGIAVTALVGIVLAAIGTGAYLLGPETVKQTRALGDDIPDLVTQLGDLPLVGGLIDSDDAADRVERWLSELPDRLAGETAQIKRVGQQIISGALAGAAILLLVVAFLIDGPHLSGTLRGLVPARHRARMDHIGAVLYQIIGRYFGGSVLVAVLHGLSVLVMGILLGVPLTPLLAVWVTVWSLVPQIGGAIGGIPFVLFALTQGLTIGIIAGVYFVAYLLFENHVLTPLIVGDAVDLSPPTTMVAAILGLAVAGLPGALLGVPLLGAAKALYIELHSPERAAAERRARAARDVPIWKFWKKRHVATDLHVSSQGKPAGADEEPQ